MPDGKRSGTPDEVKQYEAKRNAKIVYRKQQHVDKDMSEAHVGEVSCKLPRSLDVQCRTEQL